ncbi:MAG: DAK2 domain-containing protein [Ruminococcaceae bacterium]|nr:DAK2 domain-containing protein [Oscillospiraceae bacterium]
MISGAAYRQMVIQAAYAVEARKKELNDLNVFPVPDGDTGINMSATINAAARELEKMGDDRTLSEVADTAAMCMLRGARGNSGVITSLLFRGFSKRVKGLETGDAQAFAEALREGVDAAYKAVMRPAEGTILTVSMKAANAAVEAAKATGNLRVTVSSACEAAKRALAETTEQNPVLKKAGVVDAGGAGYVVILEAMLAYMRGETMVRTVVEDTPSDSNPFDAFDTEEINFTYCTEFIIDRSGAGNPAELREYLETIGDCVVVVDDDEIVKVHVHTNNPGKAIEKALELGSLDRIKIENMKIQHTQKVVAPQKTETAPVAEAAPAEPAEEKPYGFVAVAAGEGLHSIFADLGVDVVVDGGQTMNPSTDDLLKAVESINTPVAYILPNNKNIIMAAQQVAPLTEKQVVVVSTRTVAEGISAMLSFDPDSAPEENQMAMEAAASCVHTGEVTYAARDSVFEDRKIREGDTLALLGGKLIDSGRRQSDVIRRLVKEICRNSEISYVTIIFGAGTDEEAANEVRAMFEKERRDIEVAVIFGGQPVYYYIISAE